MIGWKPNPFIFVHIPKCAGTSIERTLIPVCIGPEKHHKNVSKEQRNHFWLPGPRGLQHSKLKRYARHFPIDKHFKFAFVRNPWSRAVSQIEYLRQLFLGKKLFGAKKFKDCLQIYCHTNVRIHGHDLGACQLDYCLTPTGEYSMDFVGRFEKLAEDFEKICAKIGIHPIPALPHAFDSKRAHHYSAYYDAESVEWIRTRCARDIDYFGYQFEDQSSAVERRQAKQAWRRPAE